MPTRRPGVPTRPSPRCGGGGRPALPCPLSRARRLPTPSSSPASPPQAAEAAAAAAARARLRRPAGARGAARVGGCQPALASPPPVSSLSRPGPLRRRPRRPAPPQLSRSRRGLACSARGLYTRTPLPAPARARNLVPPDTASFRCPRPGRSRPRPGDVCSWPSCGGKSVTRGRVLPAIAQTAGHQVGPV